MDLTPVTRSHRWLQQDLGVYNARDALATSAIEEPLKRLLRESGNWDYHERWMAKYIPVVMAIQKRGLGQLDRPARREKYRALAREMREVEREFIGGVERFDLARTAAEGALEERRRLALVHRDEGLQDVCQWVAAQPTRRKPDARARKVEEKYAAALRAIERTAVSERRALKKRQRSLWNKSNDLRGVLFDDWGVPPAPPAPRKQRPARSVGQEAILYVLEHLPRRCEPRREAIEALAHRFRLGHMQTYLTGLWTGPDDRLYPTIQCASARTMRLAYSDPALQQWPSELRHVVRPRPGHVFVSADYRQIEARIAVIEAGDAVDAELFRLFDDAARRGDREAEARYDVHAASARDRAGFTFEQWLALDPGLRKKHRDDAKRFRYRLTYGGSDDDEKAQTFCPCKRCVDKVPQLLALPKAERLAAQHRWMVSHPAVSAWQDAACEAVARNGNRYVSRFGYTRRFHEPWPSVRTKVVNFPMQHGAAEVINRAMITLHWRWGAPIVLQHHDNLVLEVPVPHVDYWSHVLRTVMETPVPEYATAAYPRGYVFPVDLKVADHWGAA